MVTCWERADLLALVCNVLLCFCHFPIWYPGSGVVLDCINSLSLPPFLLRPWFMFSSARLNNYADGILKTSITIHISHALMDFFGV